MAKSVKREAVEINRHVAEVVTTSVTPEYCFSKAAEVRDSHVNALPQPEVARVWIELGRELSYRDDR